MASCAHLIELQRGNLHSHFAEIHVQVIRPRLPEDDHQLAVQRLLRNRPVERAKVSSRCISISSQMRNAQGELLVPSQRQTADDRGGGLVSLHGNLAVETGGARRQTDGADV